MVQKPVRLYDAKGVVNGKEWYFEYYLLDPDTGAYNRVKERFDINRIKGRTDDETRKKRYDYARGIISQIETWLQSNPTDSSEDRSRIQLNHAIDAALKLICQRSGNIRTRQSYQNVAEIFKAWARAHGYHQLDLRSFGPDHLREFGDYLLGSRKVSNTTVNGYMSYVRSFFSELKSRKMITAHPFDEWKPLKTTDGVKNIPFTYEEVTIINRELPGAHARLFLFYSFIWYCYLRPREICQLKAGMIDLQQGLLIMQGNQTKQGRQSVRILPEQFIALLRASKVDKLPADTFLFAHYRTLEPGDHAVTRNRVSELWLEIMKNKYGVHKDMYAAKHTSAGLFINNGGTMEALQAQMGHSSIAQTERYLKKISLTGPLRKFASQFKDHLPVF